MDETDNATFWQFVMADSEQPLIFLRIWSAFDEENGKWGKKQ